LARQGAEVKEISLPHTKYAIAAYYIIATAEASANLARFDAVRYGHRCESPADLRDMYDRSRAEGFGSEVKRRIILGTYVLSSGYYDAYYLKAQKVRRLIAGDFHAAFKEVDLIASPVCPTPAFRIGENASDPLKMYLADIFTIAANLAGICGISVPCGFSTPGPEASALPIGLQLMGRPLGEADLLRAAAAYEGATDWHLRKPAL
jgi:aspartyl-tRNA(Asn)/glutamyl-tRNA(Gln) amidotransferase subunit A